MRKRQKNPKNTQTNKRWQQQKLQKRKKKQKKWCIVGIERAKFFGIWILLFILGILNWNNCHFHSRYLEYVIAECNTFSTTAHHSRSITCRTDFRIHIDGSRLKLTVLWWSLLMNYFSPRKWIEDPHSCQQSPKRWAFPILRNIKNNSPNFSCNISIVKHVCFRSFFLILLFFSVVVREHIRKQAQFLARFNEWIALTISIARSETDWVNHCAFACVRTHCHIDGTSNNRESLRWLDFKVKFDHKQRNCSLVFKH